MKLSFDRFRNAAEYLVKKRPDIFGLFIYDNELRLVEDVKYKYRKLYAYNFNTSKQYIDKSIYFPI